MNLSENMMTNTVILFLKIMAWKGMTPFCACEYVCLCVHECTCVRMCTATELNRSERVARSVIVLLEQN